MSDRVSSELLASYLSAAAERIESGSELSDRARWAIARGRRQLTADRLALLGEDDPSEHLYSAGLQPAALPGERRLSSIALDSLNEPEQSHNVADAEAQAIEFFTRLIADLEALEADQPDKAAAKRVLDAFPATVAV